MSPQPTIRLINAAESVTTDPDGVDRIIYRGDLDLQCLLGDVAAPADVANLGTLIVPAYQREVLYGTKQEELRAALRTGDVPPVEYGLRGDDIDVVQVAPNVYEVRGPVVIIDGLQRTTAMRAVLLEREEIIERNKRLALSQDDAEYEFPPTLRLGVTLHVGTQESGEREMFHIYNARQTQMSANVLLHNMIGSSVAVTAIAGLIEAPGFVLHGKVQWGQRAVGGELISARTFIMAAATLHGVSPSELEETVRRLDQLIQEIGSEACIANTRLFFEIICAAWPFGSTAKRKDLPQIKEQFLLALARLFSQYADFWKGDQLYVRTALIKKLGNFKFDQVIVDTVGQRNGAASLRRWLEQHMNKNRKDNPLRPRS